MTTYICLANQYVSALELTPPR